MPDLHCGKCEHTFNDIVHLNIHMRQYHTGDQGELVCNEAAIPRTDSIVSLSDTSGESISETGEETVILQVDGNDSISDISDEAALHNLITDSLWQNLPPSPLVILNPYLHLKMYNISII